MLKENLERMHAALAELETAARGLQNQNFADIVKSAAGKVRQLTEHPDLDKVHVEGVADTHAQNESDPTAPVPVSPFPGGPPA